MTTRNKFAIALLVFATSCAVSKYSYKIKGEHVSTTVQENKDEIDLYSMQSQQEALAAGKTRGGFTSFIGQGLTIAGKAALKLIENDQKKYVHTVADGVTDIYSYDRISDKGPYDPTGFQFSGVTIVRTFLSKKNVIDTAFVIQLEVDNSNPYEIINNGFFRMKVKKADIRYAAAKVASSRWYFPWTCCHRKEKDRMNMDVELNFTSTWVDEQGQLHSNEAFGQFILAIRDLPIDPKASDYKSAREALKGKLLDGKCFLVPRSYGYYMGSKAQLEHCYSQGIFNIGVSITECGKENMIDVSALAGAEGN